MSAKRNIAQPGSAMTSEGSTFQHPFDGPVSAGLRFLVELIAWVSGPWVAAEASLWLAIPALAVLIGLPAVFSTVGDKKHVIVPTPGPLRLVLEFGLYGVAAAAPWFVWPPGAAIAAGLGVLAAVVSGLPRARWLLAGAPPVPS